MASEKLVPAFPSQGWKQILTAKMEILHAYDRAREHARSHEVETYHGRVAEAQVRGWLAGFLPKRYGVTSGYVVSPGLPSGTKPPHFDVIIYDQLEAPVLWIEGNPDSSTQDRSLAIPVEHVLAVLEVKAKFSSGTVKDAIEHLADLAPLMAAIDEPEQRYRLHLPPNFVCGACFVELREDEQYSEAALAAMLPGIQLRGFFGGVILRDAGQHEQLSAGRVGLKLTKEPVKSTVKGRETALGEYGACDSIKVEEGVHLGAELTWSEDHFARFAFDLIAMIQGKYESGRASSAYGRGNSFTEMMRDVGAKIVSLGD
jgi:hypothetical protein